MKSDKKNQIINLINLAINEDKVNQDITSKLSISKKLKCRMFVKSKNKGILFGIHVVKLILKKIDKKIKIKTFKSDGNKLKKGTKVFLIHGNRDFLIGKKFTKTTNIEILPENYILYLDDKKVLVTHGDLLCTDDIDYQKFRKFIRNKMTLKIFNLLNNKIKTKIASFLRGKSKKLTSQKPDDIMDVNNNTVNEFFDKFDTNIIIHGHTHRKNIHNTKHMGENFFRYVLGDWHNSPSYIVYKNNKIELLDI